MICPRVSPSPSFSAKTRVDRKTKIAGEIDTFCRVHAINKYRLLQRHQIGYYIALLSAMCRRPEADDADLILQIKPAQLPHGLRMYRLMEIVEALKSSACCTPAQLYALSACLKKLPKADAAISGRIAKFEIP